MNKIVGFIVILSFFFCNYSYAKNYERVIKNQSDKTWVIVNVPNESGRYSKFDSNSNIPKACSPAKDRLPNVCILSPGATTYISYVYVGDLLFIEQNQNLRVMYNIGRNPEEFWVFPKNSKIKVHNGDITIS